MICLYPGRLIRSDRRSLGLEIRKIPEGGAELLIRAPRRMKIAYIEWFINEKEWWITEKYLAALVEKPRPQMMEIPEYVTEQWLRTEGAERFQQKTAFWAARMKVTYGRITIRDQRTRWGSCSSRGNLNFNWRLLLMPERVMDYVIVHELAYRREMTILRLSGRSSKRICRITGNGRQWLKENGVRYAGPVELPKH